MQTPVIKNGLVALALEGDAEALFAQRLVILPGVIEEVDAVIERLGDHVIDDVLAGGGAEMIAAHAEDGDLEAGAAQGRLGTWKPDLELPYTPGKLGMIGLGSVRAGDRWSLWMVAWACAAGVSIVTAAAGTTAETPVTAAACRKRRRESSGCACRESSRSSSHLGVVDLRSIEL